MRVAVDMMSCAGARARAGLLLTLLSPSSPLSEPLSEPWSKPLSEPLSVCRFTADRKIARMSDPNPCVSKGGRVGRKVG